MQIQIPHSPTSASCVARPRLNFISLSVPPVVNLESSLHSSIFASSFILLVDFDFILFMWSPIPSPSYRIRLRRLLTRLLRYNRCRESSWIGESLFPTVYSSSSYRSCILHVLFSHAAPSFESVFYTLLPTLDLLRLRTFSIFMNCTFSANRFSRWRLVHHHRQFFRYRLGLFVKQVYLVFVFDSFLSIVCSWTDRKLIFRARSRASVPATTTSELVATSVTSSPSNDKKLTKCLSRISIVTLFASTTTRMSATTSWSSIRWPSFLIFNSLVV